ncbi:hypothetical protein ACFSHQ_06110 [Gemmobacter lanyuensis]
MAVIVFVTIRVVPGNPIAMMLPPAPRPRMWRTSPPFTVWTRPSPNSS